MSKKEENHLKITYEYSNQYNNFFVNGGHGGLTPTGKILLDFFSENFEFPSTEVREIRPDGTLGKVIKTDAKTKSIIRRKVTGIVLDVETAVSIRDWLDAKIKEHGLISGELSKAREAKK